MKRILSPSIIIACIAFISFSCSMNEIINNPQIDESDYQTKSVISSNAQSFDAESFRVSEAAARLYMKYFNDSVCKWSVTPYVSDGDTLFYIFNSDNGWKIVSGDSRTSPILAENPSGRIVLSETMDIPLRIILDDSKSVVQYYRSHNGVGDTASTRVWKPFVEIATKSYLAKLGNRDSDPHWVKVLIGTTNSISNVEDTGHLMSTTWDQESPWNDMAPILSGYTDHCKAGCVAVALGQVMYYFHSVFGYPSGLYENVWLDSQGLYAYPWQQIILNNYNSNSTRWSSMKKNRYSGGMASYVADLLAYIGHDIHIVYGNSLSSATLTQANLSHFGFSSTIGYMSTCAPSIINNILNNKPVIVSGENASSTYAHTWVIDGYSKDEQYVSSTYGYYYVNDPSSLNGTFNGYNIVGIYNDEEISILVPGCVNGMQTVDYNTIEHHYFYHNWGESNGQYDSVRQAVYQTWYFGNLMFDGTRLIFYDLSSL